ncbi:MAG: Hsp70 family protein [Rikenellaceae bacterium]|nr:Hsp70 family protein [Rikenellaceae bacterium]
MCNGIQVTPSPYVLGIDLGTTNSSVAIYKNGEMLVLPIDNGNITMPTAVRFKNRRKDTVSIGKQAKEYIHIKPDEVFTSVKSLMGDNEWMDKSEIREKFKIEGVQFTPTDIATIFLRELIAKAEATGLGEGSFERAVITVPANSSPAYKQHIWEAAEAAGLGETDEHGNVKHDDSGHPAGVYILEEPTAAALAYAQSMGFDDTKNKEQRILVYDLGGGTFDATVLKLKSEIGKATKFTIMSTHGIIDLGGDTFDWIIAEIIAKHIQDETDIDVLTNPSSIEAKSKIKAIAEQTKINFSIGNDTEIEIDLSQVVVDSTNPEKRASSVIISRESFMNKLMPLLDKTVECIKTVLKEASVEADDIDRIILVGGSSKAPWVRKIVTEMFREPYVAQNVDTIVAQGASYYGHMGPIVNPLISTTSHYYGIEVQSGLFSPMVLKNTPFDGQEYVSHEATFYNPNDSGRAIVTGFITQDKVEYTEKENGARISDYLVTQENNLGEPMFRYIGEFDITVPRKAAGQVAIVLTMKVFKDNHVEVIATAEGKETPVIWKY